MTQSTGIDANASPSPAERRLAYVIYDFSIKGGLRDNLIYAREHFAGLAGSTVRVEYPDANAPGGQGEIWSNIVRPKLHEAAHVIAYVDKPNANVGFEIGYALGCGNRDSEAESAIVALALHATQVPDWLKRPPFGGFNAVQFKDEQALIDTIEQRSGFHLREPVQPGAELLFLCPESGGKYLRGANQAGQWRTLNGSGWALKDLPKQLAGVGGIAWMIPPTVAERDGPENTALSVVAGFAKACGIELRVLLHKEAREVLDIFPEAHLVEDLTAFNQLIHKIHDDLKQHIDEASRPAAERSEVDALARPEVGDLPVLPHTAELTERFIGRQRWLEDFYLALEGLRARWMRALPGDRNPVQLFWYHGLGGMGKTTLVRRAMLDTGVRFPEARVAYWEWDRDLWRKPLDRPPDSADDVFDAIAHRLAQLYGVEALDPYWRVEARIANAAPQASQAKARFHNEHNDWVVKAQASSALRAALDALDLLRSKKALSDHERSRLFRRWIDQGGFELNDPAAALDGTRLQREALISCLTKLTQEAPLLMVFDTCEVLSVDAEQALRTLLVEICDRRKAVLVLIASRLAPDVGVTPGSKETWRDSLGDDRLKIERFDDLTLTTTEIEQYLQRFDPTLPQPGALAQMLQRVTLGVPLAVRVLVETEGGLEAMRPDLDAWSGEDDHTATRETALYVLYERLADRFLLHVHDEEHLHAIIALAITTDANKDLLVTHWGGRHAWAERLRELGRRYSLLSGGDLHPVVRGHLRRSLRAGKYSDESRTIARELSGIVTGVPEEASFDDRYFQHKLGRINLDTWTSADPSTLDIAPGVALAMAYEQRLDNWLLLAAELAEVSPGAPGRKLLLELQQVITVTGRNLSFPDFVPRYFWMTTLSAATREEYFKWLAGAQRGRTWSKEEAGALHILRALNARDAPDALPRFAKALEEVPADRIPLVSQLGEALFELAREAWQRNPASPDVETSLSLALRIDYQASSAHAALGDFFRLGKNFDKARAHFDAARNLEPDNTAHLVNLAELSRAQRRFDDAREWANKALAIDANYVWAHNQHGFIERDLRHYEQAVAAFTRAHELDTTEPVFANNLADTYRQWKQFDKAAEWVERTLAIRSDYAWAHNQRGLIESDQKHYEQAIAAFTKAHELDATEPAFTDNLADVYRFQKQYDKATEWMERTFAIRPNFPWAHYQRGLIARARKDHVEAMAGFAAAHELDPTEPLFPSNLADLYRVQKQYDKAAEWVERTLAIRPDYSWAHNQRGLIESDLKHYGDAIAAFTKAHELEPTEPAFADNLADMYRLQKQYDKAAEWMERTLAIKSDYPWAHSQRGLIAKALKKYDQAIEAFIKAHELDSTVTAFANNLADTYRLQKRYDKAVDWVDRTLAIQSDYPWAHNQRGLIATDLKQYDEAIAAFMKAAELDSTEPQFANNVADTYRLAKQYDKAAAWVERTLAIRSDYASAHNLRGLIKKAREQYDEAIAAFTRAHELDPAEPAFAYNLTDTHRLLERYDEALKWVERTLAIKSDHASAHNQRGLIEKALKHYDEAIAAFTRAHELDPTEPAFAYNLTDTYRLLERYEKADEWVARTLAINADYASAYNQRGLIEKARGHNDAAIAAFTKTCELDSTEPVFANNLADAYRLAKQFEKAIEWVEKTLAIQPGYATAHNQRGLIESDRKNYDQAIAAFTKAHELDSTEPIYTDNVADMYRLQEKYDQATEWVERTFAIRPAYPWGHNRQGLIAKARERYDEAIAAFTRAHELDSTEPAFAYNLADTYRLQKEYDKANQWVDETLRIKADHAWAYYQRGLIDEANKQWEAAAAAYMKASELDPAEPEFSYQAGWSLYEQLELDAGETWARRALGLDDTHLGAQNLLGAIAFVRRRWNEAAETFRRLATVAASEAVLPWNAARAYMRLGRFAEAEEQLTEAVRIKADESSVQSALALLRHLSDRPEAAEFAERARTLEENFDSLLVFAMTRPEAASADASNDAIQAFEKALALASRLDVEHSVELVVYTLARLQAKYGARVRESILQNTSPAWSALRQAVSHADAAAVPGDPRVAGLVKALHSPLPPREQLFTSWKTGSP